MSVETGYLVIRVKGAPGIAWSKQIAHTLSPPVGGNDHAKQFPIADMVQMCAVYMLDVTR